MNLSKKLSSFEEISKAQLSKILSVNSGKKHLVLQSTIIKPLERVCGVKWLKSNGVDKIFKLESQAANFDVSAVFFIIFSENATFRLVLEHIKSKMDESQENKFHIIVVPKVSFTFEEELELSGLYANVHLYSFQWMPIYIDTSILSLEIPGVHDNLFVHQNLEWLGALSKNLWQIFLVTGKPNFILGIGDLSNALLTQYDLLCEDIGDTDKLSSDFGGLVIMDRNVDYASVFLTPGTYSGLVNEVYEVCVGSCEYKEETTEKNIPQVESLNKKQPVAFNLDSSHDSIYHDIRYRYFTEVTAILRNLTTQLKGEKVKSDGISVAEMKHYVQTQLKTIQQKKKFITNHLAAAETIINVIGPRYEQQQLMEQDLLQNRNKGDSLTFLEEYLLVENDLYASLRLFCLLLMTQKLTASEVELIWMKFIHQFGFQKGIAYTNLINMGLLEENQASISSNLVTLPPILKMSGSVSNNFYQNANRLKQIPSDPNKINLNHPTCMSYVFAGSYIPFIAQIASLVLSSMPLVDIKMKLDHFGPLIFKDEKNYPLTNRTLLLYVLGGVTYAEIAACHLLENLTGSTIIILSDKVISGSEFVQIVEIVEKLERKENRQPTRLVCNIIFYKTIKGVHEYM